MRGSPPPRIVVTGGAGAIGVNLVERLLRDEPEQIVVIDDESSGHARFLPDDPRLSFVHLDLRDREPLAAVVTEVEPQLVFHLAAHFANQNSVEHPHADIATNVGGTLNLLQACDELPALRKLVYASSSCVYGDAEPMVEDAAVAPFETPYAIDKLTAELYVRYFARQRSLPALSVRLFNTYGPYELPGAYRNVIPNFIDHALRGEQLVITGTGDETRDFTYASDTAELMLLAARSDFATGEVFNGGRGQQLTIGELAQLIIEGCGSTSTLRRAPRRGWDRVRHRVADVTRSRDLLGYTPRVGIAEGLRRTIAWHRGLR